MRQKSAPPILYFLMIICFGGGLLNPLDIDIAGGPAATLPVGDSSSPFFDVGGGGTLYGEAVFSHSLSAGLELNAFLIPLKGTDTTPNFLAAGLRGGYFHFPQTRLRLEYSLAFGPYLFNYSGKSYGDMWWKLSAEGGYRFSPEFTLTGNLSYIHLNTTTEPMYTGITAGIGVRYQFDTKGRSGGEIYVDLDQPEPLFPIYSALYKENSIGALTIRNDESADITDVRVSFRAGNYTASTQHCGSVSMLRKHGSLELPLYADFSETIQNFTEDGKIPGELVIAYKLLGSEREKSVPLVLSVHNRNSIRWTDPSLIVSFTSPNSPEVLDYSKYIVGIARNQLRSGLNREMQFALYLLEGLTQGDVKYSYDTITPYTEFHRDETLMDYIQFPYQTLAYHTGDYDDLGLLYASALESVGIEAALICLDGDFLVAFSLDITDEEADRLFNSRDRLLNMEGKYWIPLSMSVIREGFMNSWYKGIQGLNDSLKRGEDMDVIPMQEAWKTYPPSGVTGSEAQFQKPSETRVIAAAEAELKRYITADFGPRIKAVQEEIRATGGSPSLFNRLGLLYVRAGLFDDAKAQFLVSAESDSLSALVNLGNIALLQGDYGEARKWFAKALEIEPDNPSAQKGWDRVQTELME